MYAIIRSLLFRLNPESAHHFTLGAVKLLLKFPGVKFLFFRPFRNNDPRLRRKLWGLEFQNPVGLAAGFDKNAGFLREFQAMGFGFLEIGTVTPLGQPGNPQPRLFRLKEDGALINRMGFNNEGMEVVKKNLQNRPKGIIVGGNIGKNKVTPNEEAESDYLKCFETLYPFVDYFVINVSSPNTPDLRKLQDKEPLQALIISLQQANQNKPEPKPILLKIAPDLTESQLDDIIDISRETALDGLIATNTTISREGLKTSNDTLDAIGAGGLSGAPVKARSTAVVQYIRKELPHIPIIAVGGIMTAEDALEKLRAGANLVQVYTGLVYEGPGLIKRINDAILKDS